jgi:hypothetical protein
MKKISTLFSLVLILGHVFGQNINSNENQDGSVTSSSNNFTQDSVTISIGYYNESYYNLDSGEVSNISNADWDLAFQVSQYGASIRINGANGTRLYVYPNGDTAAWSTVDTTDVSNWNSIYNSNSSWSTGAFNQNVVASDPFDYGWGTYSMITHFVSGDSLHIIKLSDNSFKKLHLQQLASGSYSFKYADLDGSNEVSAMISKSDYVNKNFAYYSLQTNEEIDREPSNDSWHMLITKILEPNYPFMGGFTPYALGGILTNVGFITAKVEGVHVDSANQHAFDDDIYSSEMDIIGYNWKTYMGQPMGYVIEDSLSYFIKDTISNKIWKIVMLDYGSGDFTFNVEQVEFDSEPTGENELISKTLFNVYPNPAVGSEVSILYDIVQLEDNNRLDIFDMNGRIVKSMKLYNSGFNDKKISLDNFESGIYLVSLTNGNEVIKRKLIVQ